MPRFPISKLARSLARLTTKTQKDARLVLLRQKYGLAVAERVAERADTYAHQTTERLT